MVDLTAMKIVATTGHLNSRRCLAMPNELCHVQPSFWHFTSLSCAFVLLDAVLQLQNSSLDSDAQSPCAFGSSHCILLSHFTSLAPAFVLSCFWLLLPARCRVP